MSSTRENQFRTLWKILGVAGWSPVEQHKFHPRGNWRFDFAWLSVRVAVEIHGAEWTGGRHTRGQGMIDDCEKARIAMGLGWMVIPVAGSELDKRPGDVMDQIRAVLELRSGK